MFSFKNQLNQIPEHEVEHEQEEQSIDIDQGKDQDCTADGQGKCPLKEDSLQNG